MAVLILTYLAVIGFAWLRSGYFEICSDYILVFFFGGINGLYLMIFVSGFFLV